MEEEEKEKDKKVESLINELLFALSWYVDGYHFDECHKIKHRRLIRRAQKMLGIPVTIEEWEKSIILEKKGRKRTEIP